MATAYATQIVNTQYIFSSVDPDIKYEKCISDIKMMVLYYWNNL